jgi:hypothetical protein
MTPVSGWLVRVAHLHLAAGFILGGVLLAGKGVALPPAIWLLRAVHAELLLFGFAVQLAFGVALWILPRTPARRSERPAAVAGVLLNAGILLAVAGYLGAGPALAGAGRALETVAVIAFAWAIWPRVRAVQAH